jgi:hypothetical protein
MRILAVIVEPEEIRKILLASGEDRSEVSSWGGRCCFAQPFPTTAEH